MRPHFSIPQASLGQASRRPWGWTPVWPARGSPRRGVIHAQSSPGSPSPNPGQAASSTAGHAPTGLSLWAAALARALALPGHPGQPSRLPVPSRCPCDRWRQTVLTTRLLCAPHSSATSSVLQRKFKVRIHLPVLATLVPAPTASVPRQLRGPSMCTLSPVLCLQNIVLTVSESHPQLSVQGHLPDWIWAAQMSEGPAAAETVLCWPCGLGQGSKGLSLS